MVVWQGFGHTYGMPKVCRNATSTTQEIGLFTTPSLFTKGSASQFFYPNRANSIVTIRPNSGKVHRCSRPRAAPGRWQPGYDCFPSFAECRFFMDSIYIIKYNACQEISIPRLSLIIRSFSLCLTPQGEQLPSCCL